MASAALHVGEADVDNVLLLMSKPVTISGLTVKQANGGAGSLHRAERIHGTFERTFSLGKAVNGDKVQATYRDGVLEVRVPKAEGARMREIEIKVG